MFYITDPMVANLVGHFVIFRAGCKAVAMLVSGGSAIFPRRQATSFKFARTSFQINGLDAPPSLMSRSAGTAIRRRPIDYESSALTN